MFNNLRSRTQGFRYSEISMEFPRNTILNRVHACDKRHLVAVVFDSLPQRRLLILRWLETKPDKEGHPSILGQTKETDSGYWKKIQVIPRGKRASQGLQNQAQEGDGKAVPEDPHSKGR